MVPGKSENAAWKRLCEVRVEIVELVQVDSGHQTSLRLHGIGEILELVSGQDAINCFV